MNENKERIHKYIQSHRDKIISDLKELIKIPSVRGGAETDAPFGKACADALKYVQKLYEREGVETKLNRNDGYLLSYFGEGEKSIGIFAHADVVPVGDNWLLTNPFDPVEKDGFLIGRGALDDKSGVIASLWCVKMLKELDFPFKSRIVCFTGANEESGMEDVKNYLSQHKKPDFSIVPDTAFSLYRGNKGCIRFSLKSTEKLPFGVLISGGTGATVIGDATAVIPFEQELYDEILSWCNERVSAECADNKIIVEAKGVAKHSALPEGALSAVVLLAGVLKKCEIFVDNRIIGDICEISGCNYGEYFGIESDDCEFGRLTCVLTKVTTEENGCVKLDFNIRYGDVISDSFIKTNINEKIKDSVWSSMEVGYCSAPHCLPQDDAYVKSLLGVYNDFAGCEEKSHVNAGGTYRQYIQEAIEIGTTNIWGCQAGLPEGHGGAHQPDECINLDGFLEAVEITMLMILECDKTVGESL